VADPPRTTGPNLPFAAAASCQVAEAQGLGHLRTLQDQDAIFVPEVWVVVQVHFEGAEDLLEASRSIRCPKKLMTGDELGMKGDDLIGWSGRILRCVLREREPEACRLRRELRSREITGATIGSDMCDGFAKTRAPVVAVPNRFRGVEQPDGIDGQTSQQ